MITKFSSTFSNIFNSIGILRVVLGIIMATHGFARIYHDSVYIFGDFLTSKGFFFGNLFAWIITIFDITFGFFLIVRKLVSCASFWFIFVLTMGMVLVHFKNGWFVVGHGQNGIEYSILLISCFIVLLKHESDFNFKVKFKKLK